MLLLRHTLGLGWGWGVDWAKNVLVLAYFKYFSSDYVINVHVSHFFTTCYLQVETSYYVITVSLLLIVITVSSHIDIALVDATSQEPRALLMVLMHTKSRPRNLPTHGNFAFSRSNAPCLNLPKQFESKIK